MNNKSFTRLALLGVALLATSSAIASEWRTPWLGARGPIRYTFDKVNQDGWNFNTWSSTHIKEAHRAFLKHGTDTQELTALYFNKADFTMNEIFPDSQVPLGSQEYNPLLKLASLKPRARYMEYGINLGGQVDYEVWKDKGRIGLRANVPVRRITVTRQDITQPLNDEIANYVATLPINITRNNPTSSMPGGTVQAVGAGTTFGAIDGAANSANALAVTNALAAAQGHLQTLATKLSDKTATTVATTASAVGAMAQAHADLGAAQSAVPTTGATNGQVTSGTQSSAVQAQTNVELAITHATDASTAAGHVVTDLTGVASLATQLSAATTLNAAIGPVGGPGILKNISDLNTATGAVKAAADAVPSALAGTTYTGAQTAIAAIYNPTSVSGPLATAVTDAAALVTSINAQADSGLANAIVAAVNATGTPGLTFGTSDANKLLNITTPNAVATAIEKAGGNAADHATASGAGLEVNGTTVATIAATDKATDAATHATALAAAGAPLAQVIAAGLPATDRAKNATEFVAGLQANANDINSVAAHGDAASLPIRNVVVNAYRLDFVQALEQSDHTSAVSVPGVSGFNIFGNNVAVGDTEKNTATVAIAYAPDAETLKDQGYVAWMTSFNPSPNEQEIKNDGIVKLDPATATTDLLKVNYFDSAQDYTSLKPNELANYWLIFRRAADASDQNGYFAPNSPSTKTAGKGLTIDKNIRELMQNYQETPLDFMQRHGFEFESTTRTGLGDVDMDLFYEHTFGSDLAGQVWLGVRAPSGASKDLYGNPYKGDLGNGGHTEIRLGSELAWQPLSWMNMRVDAQYAYAIPVTEHRTATFAGSTVKNIGPQADADVDFSTFVTHLDFTFFHPKKSALRSVAGYEFYYKTADTVKYKAASMQSWLGGQWDGTKFAQNLKPLDNALAAANTEVLSHKLRTEISYDASAYFELFVGGSFTFAGQNAMQDADAHGGFNVRF